MNRLPTAVSLLWLALVSLASAADRYVLVGRTNDTKCPAHVTVEKEYQVNPAFTVSPDQALAASGIRCPNKLQISVFADSENYYITKLDQQPGTVETYVINGKTGNVSVLKPR
jgi:hypothetical protein